MLSSDADDCKSLEMSPWHHSDVFESAFLKLKTAA